MRSSMLRLLALSCLVVAAACGPDNKGERYCFGDGVCVEPDGNIVDPNGNTVCSVTGTCGDTGPGDTVGGDAAGDEPPPPPACSACPVVAGVDSDGDCVSDADELAYFASNLSCAGLTLDPTTNSDVDGDGVPDGCENLNFDGTRQQYEMNACNPDTDGDGIPDGLEDRNHNGRVDPGESHPVRTDSDFDGIPDGLEDRNANGRMDSWVDVNSDGCYTPGVDTPGESSAASLDSDGDGLPDANEDRNLDGLCDPGETCAFVADTDCDLLPDGKEDKNSNRVVNTGETDPLNPDTDADGLLDGVEDANRNGAWDQATETSPLRIDSDGDGIRDGVEDRNLDGQVTPWHECGANTTEAACVIDAAYCSWSGACAALNTGGRPGVYDPGIDVPGESDPRKWDSDGDGIGDVNEDLDRDGECNVGLVDFISASGQTRLCPGGTDAECNFAGTTCQSGVCKIASFSETCAWLADTDGDGLVDGLEDINRDGRLGVGETSPIRQDSDFDGLLDGCPAWAALAQCEDKNNNGRVDPGETDPLSRDTDGDLLADGCEVNFDPVNCVTIPCSTDPLHEDTDADGFSDGEEDVNHNCTFEAGIGETDPRVFTPPPATGSLEAAEFEVCATRNLKPLSFAVSPRETHDYRVAFEVEFDSGATPKPYLLHAFGKDRNNNGFSVDDPLDALWGHAFQSPKNVEDAIYGELNRDVYGFALVSTTALSLGLDDILDNDVRPAIEAIRWPTELGVVTQVADVTSRPAHDDIQHGDPGLTDFRINRAQRVYEITVPARRSALQVRNELARAVLLQLDPGAVGTNEWPANLPQQDPNYPNVNCPASPQCYLSYTVYLGAVQRVDRGVRLDDHRLVLDPTAGRPQLVFVFAITQNDSASGGDQRARYEDRLTRLEDLTGGSAVARYDADRAKICERRGTQQAKADLLWVVDDSRSMQSMINRLLQAAQDARSVLLANREIVDFRVAMTTTNPAIAYRNQCPVACDTVCTGNAECNYSCSSQTLGCLKVCPAECNPTGCNGTTCTCGACTGTSVCTGTCLDPAGIIARVLDESALDDTGVDARAWMDAVAAADVTRYPMPGGGGTFYFEDSAYLDCKSASGSSAVQNQDRFINSCLGKAGFADFFAGSNRLQLLDNAGFLGADVEASCTTAPMSLVYDVDAVGPPPTCQGSCPRLTASCADGPTVLVSQMCDLIRAMGGFPCTINPADVVSGTTSSTRTHSALEMGSRSARRLIEKMLPAYPRDYGTEAERKVHLRLDCAAAGSGRSCPTGLDIECDDHEECVSGACVPTGNCEQPCDPRAMVLGASGNVCTEDRDCARGELCDGGQCYVDCRPIPLVSVFLSDEEDAYFKDECAIQPGLPPPLATWDSRARDKTDSAQLPELCYWTAGDPLTIDSNCQGLGETACLADTSCVWDATAVTCRANVVGVPCTEAYCEARGYATGWPAGYDPDLTNFSADIYASTKWRDGSGTACSAAPGDLGTTCIGDPCKALINEAECQAPAMQRWCTWSNFQCVNRCGAYTSDTTNPSAAKFAEQKAACLSDPICQWNQGEVRSSDQKNACVLKVQVNDCQACKRLRRTREAIDGSDGLIGFGYVGPVYAIARNKGAGGQAIYNYNALVGQDECAGGFVTWGRGDGESFRDLAIGTLGRTQNVCTQSADGYRPFMQLLITDIAALSAPYPLSGAPIAATIKVGIARPNGTGGFDYIEVPRSRTSGFFYNGTTNSIGFKSDPVDGVCGGGACSLDGVIELTEINYAAQAPHVPKTQDLVFISYRYWLAVPCAERCGDGESCVRLFCPEESTLASCDDDSDCNVLGERCLDDHCQVDCTPGESLEVCTCGNCPACHVCNTDTGECVLATNDPCICDPRHEACRQQFTEADCISLATQPTGQAYCVWDPLTGECGLADRCEPGPINTCGPGAVCDESCTCVRSADCPDGFYADGTIRDCPAAEQCCRDWAAAAVICPAQGAGTCATAGRCYWDGAACLPTSAPCCAPETGCGVDGDCTIGQTCNTGVSPARCAPPLEDPVCRTDPELGLSRIVCESSPPCVCIGEACASDADCNLRDLVGCRSLSQSSCNAVGTAACTWDGAICQPSWQTCDLGTGRCTPACHPVREYCDDAFPPCGCQFVPP